MTIEPQPDAGEGGETKPARASGRRWLIASLVVATIAVLALTVLTSYLWNVHSQYVTQNEQLRDEAAELGGQLARNRARAEEVRAELADTYAQLEEAKATINGLADSEAQAGDDRQALVDVADGLQQCADARQNLIDHLKEASKWTTSSLRAYEEATTKYCNQVAKSLDEVMNG